MAWGPHGWVLRGKRGIGPIDFKDFNSDVNFTFTFRQTKTDIINTFFKLQADGKLATNEDDPFFKEKRERIQTCEQIGSLLSRLEARHIS